MLTVRIYGRGYCISKLNFDEKEQTQFTTEASKNNVPVGLAILDYRFNKYIKPSINSIQDLCEDSFLAVLPNDESIFEVWFNRKKVAKIPIKNIVYQSTLFPLFNVHYLESHDSLFKGRYFLKEQIVECLGVFKILSQNFNIDEFKFLVSKNIIFNHAMLIYFNYQGNSFQKMKDDCLLEHQEILKF